VTKRRERSGPAPVQAPSSIFRSLQDTSQRFYRKMFRTGRTASPLQTTAGLEGLCFSPAFFPLLWIYGTQGLSEPREIFFMPGTAHA